MTALNNFYRFIAPSVPGCPEPMIDQEIVNTAVDICTRTQIWQVWNDAQTIAAGNARYEVDPQSGARVNAILSAKLDGEELVPASADQLDLSNEDWRNATGEPTMYYLDDESGEIVLVPKPIAAGSLEVLVSYATTYDATTVPDVLYRRYAEGFSAGAKARLLAMRQPWGDANLAALNIGIYEDCVRSILSLVSKAGTRMPLRVRSVP